MAVYDELNIVSLPMIGRAFRRDHTTALHALSRADKYRTEIDELRTAVARAVRSGERYKPPQEESEPPHVAEPPCEWPSPRVVEEDKRATVFVPRKVRPRVQAVARRRAVMTGYLMGDPGEQSARVDRGETSKGAW